MELYTDIIENMLFESEAVPLCLCQDWLDLKRKINLWIIIKYDDPVTHTSTDNKGIRFTVCTTKDEAQWLADLYNKERHGGFPVYRVKHFLEKEE